MLPISELAAAVVANLVYFSDSAAGEKRSPDRWGRRYDRLKTRLTSQVGGELLLRFEERHAAPDDRAALRQELANRLAADPTFRVELDFLIEEISPWP
jgi:hypothetical protein